MFSQSGCSSEWLLPFKKMLDNDVVDVLHPMSKDGHHSRIWMQVECIPYLLIRERPFQTAQCQPTFHPVVLV